MITKESLIKATEDYDSIKFIDINGDYTIVGIAIVDPDECAEDCVIGTYDLNNSMLDFMGVGISVDKYLFYRDRIDRYKLTNVDKFDDKDSSPLKILSEKQLADIILELLTGYIKIFLTELKESNLK